MIWEYCQGTVNVADVGPLLNALGEQGWELVQIVPAPEFFELDRRTHYGKFQYFMKRARALPLNAGDEYSLNDTDLSDVAYSPES